MKQTMGRFMTMLAVVVLTAVLVLPVGAEQIGGGVEAEGYAGITGGRKDQAREAALQNAFRRAVEQVVGVAVESKSVVKDSELLNDKIFARSHGFIKTYRILSETVEADAYRIRIFAAVSRYKLEQGLDDAGLLIRKVGKPRIAVVVLEKNTEGQPTPGGTVETQLITTLGKRGYALVDRQAMVAVEREAAKGGGDQTDAVVRAAAGGGAEMVIIGRAEASAAPALGGTSLRPVQVSATARAVEVETGELLATAQSSQRALNVNPAAAGVEALQKAAVEITESLHRQIIAAWTKRVTGVRTVRMTVIGIPASETGRLQEALREQAVRVETVHDRGYKDQQLRMDLEITGALRDVVDDLGSLELERATLSVAGYSAGHLQVRWQPRSAKGGRIK